VVFSIVPPHGWGVQRCRFISESYLDRFLAFAEARLATSGETVDAGRLRELAGEFQARQAEVDPLLGQSFTDCNMSRLNREREDKRKDHFGRLLVEQFASQFTVSGGPTPRRGGLTHSVLPGFFHALALALGADILETYRKRCALIVDRLRAQNAGDLDWTAYFEDPEAEAIVLEVLASLAAAFENFDRRKAWFIDLVNREQSGGEESGRFEEIHFDHMISALFDKLKTGVREPKARQHIEREMGAEMLSRAERLLRQIP
jgi:hypothetical protein